MTGDVPPGRIDAFSQYVDNHGPLVRMNLLDNNAIDGHGRAPCGVDDEDGLG